MENKKYTVHLKVGHDTEKLALVKVIKEATGEGLKEAKEFLDAIPVDIYTTDIYEDAVRVRDAVAPYCGEIFIVQ